MKADGLLFGGEPVIYDGQAGSLTLGHVTLTINEWLELRRRVDLLLKRMMQPADWKQLKGEMAWLGKRDRLPTELRDHEAPRSINVGVPEEVYATYIAR